MLQVKPGRIGRHRWQQNSPNLWTAFQPSPVQLQTHRESGEDVPVDGPLDEAEDRDAVHHAKLREQRELGGDIPT